MLHKVYEDEQEVRRLTREHLAAGRTVLQMFALADTEANHSLRVLDMLGQLPDFTRVLSLGCGVGGMERYWQNEHPEWAFELVNLSQAQLDLCVCRGRKVWADAQHYQSDKGPFDLVVLAYVLGHLDVPEALATARANAKKGGRVLVLDVCDGSHEFDERFHYGTPTSEQLVAAGFVEREAPHPWRLMPLIHDTEPWVTRHATPKIWTRDV